MSYRWIFPQFELCRFTSFPTVGFVFFLCNILTLHDHSILLRFTGHRIPIHAFRDQLSLPLRWLLWSDNFSNFWLIVTLRPSFLLYQAPPQTKFWALYTHIYIYIYDNTPLAGLHYLNPLNHSWPSDRQVVSLISGQGYFTFLYEHTKNNIHNRESGRKENKQTRTWVSSERKKGEVCDTFAQLSVHLWVARACIQAKFL